MKILYDATPLLMRSAGVKNYHHALLSRLLPSLGPQTLRLFPYLPGLAPNRNERSNYAPASTVARLGAVLAANYLRLPLGECAARGADLFHLTHHLMHPPRRIRLTSLIHDPSCLLMPECHTASNVRYFRHFFRCVLPLLSGVIVPSEAVKRDLVERLGASTNPITVIPHGVEERFFSPGPAAPARAAYHLPDQYILTVGSIEPRKNLLTLLEACLLLPESLRRAYPLVIAGAAGWKNASLRRAIEQSRSDGVRAIGYVAPEDLPAVYSQAAVFVFPSLYEGFGLPLLEAMAAGAPLVTSNASAMPEIAGPAALTVDPRSPSELARAIERLLLNRAEAQALAETDRCRARQFTWERTAKLTMAFFERAAGA